MLFARWRGSLVQEQPDGQRVAVVALPDFAGTEEYCRRRPGNPTGPAGLHWEVFRTGLRRNIYAVLGVDSC